VASVSPVGSAPTIRTSVVVATSISAFNQQVCVEREPAPLTQASVRARLRELSYSTVSGLFHARANRWKYESNVTKSVVP
jgi:hypothetical protein